MLLQDTLDTLNYKAPGTTIPRWESLLKELKVLLKKKHVTYSGLTAIDNRSISYIRAILSRFDIYAALKKDAPLDIYTDMCLPLVPLVPKSLSIIHSAPADKDIFLQDSELELIFNCDNNRSIMDIPIWQNWATWKDISVFQIPNLCPTKEISMNNNGGIIYKEDTPEYMISKLDIPLLAMKYYKYAKYCKDNNEDYWSGDFIFKYVLDMMPEQVVDNWLLDTIISTLLDDDSYSYRVRSLISTGVTRSCSLRSLEELYDIVTDVKEGSMLLSQFLELPLLLDGSLMSWMRDIDTISLPDELSFYRYNMLVNHKAFYILLLIVQGNKSKYSQLKSKLRHGLDKVNRVPVANVKDHNVRELMKSQMALFKDLLG